MKPIFADERVEPARRFPTDSTSPQSAALMYLAMGLEPVAIHGVREGLCTCNRGAECNGSTGKHPRVTSWQSVAVTDALVRQWFDAWPESNVGLRMGGERRLVALDVDGEKGRRTLAALEDKHGLLPQTLTSKSGRPDGGTHFVFGCQSHQDPSRIVNRTGRHGLGDGLDVRGPGAQIVVAPSLHASGNRYRWQDIQEPADLPDWLYDLMVQRPEPPRAEPRPPRKTTGNRVSATERASRYVSKMLPAISECGGHDAAFEVAAVLCRGFSLSEAEAFDIFWNEYNPRCQPPWSRHEAKHKIREGAKADRELGYLLDAERAWSPPPAGTGSPANDSQDDDDGWRARLQTKIVKKRGEEPVEVILSSLENAVLFLQHHPHWRGLLAWNEFRTEIATTRIPSWGADYAPAIAPICPWSETDLARLQAWFSENESVRFGKEILVDAIKIVAESHAHHPVREWLNGLDWDGVPRVNTWLQLYMGAGKPVANDLTLAQPAAYLANVGRWFLISAVARVFKPGCKVDTMPVFEGDQGLKKSTALETLFGSKWHRDTPLDFQSKDRFIQIQGAWVYEVAELDGFDKYDVNRTKSFLSSKTDTYRPPFGRGNVEIQRQVVFAGTVNGREYLRDTTGNRRFWPIACNVVDHESGTVDLAGLARDRDQIWAEAVHLYRKGERHWPEASDKLDCDEQQSSRVQRDEWEAGIRDWIGSRTEVGIGEILSQHLKIEEKDWKQTEQNRVASVLRSLQFVRYQKRDEQKRRTWRYMLRPVTT